MHYLCVFYNSLKIDRKREASQQQEDTALQDQEKMLLFSITVTWEKPLEIDCH